MSDDIFARLSSPFDPSEVDWRVGSTNADKSKGMALAFVDTRVVMDRLDTVVGPAGWQDSYMIAEGKTVCNLAIKCGDEWVWKADGAGDTDFEAAKGALSDAFKRAAVRWGIGRYLYNLASPWVPIESRGKSHFITAEGKRTLDALLRKGAHAPSSTEPTPKPMTADQWTKKAISEIEAIDNMNSLDMWLLHNEAARDKLNTSRPALARQVTGAIEDRVSDLK